MLREAWHAEVHGVAKSQTWPRDWTEQLSHQNILVIPIFSGWVEAVHCCKADSLTVAKKVWENVFYAWFIKCDPGTHFPGQILRGLTKTLKASWNYHSSYEPQTSGSIDRNNTKTGLWQYKNYEHGASDQIRSDQSLSRVWIFATPWITACQASLSITNSWSSLRLTSIESVMPSSHVILCRPLLLLPPIHPSIRVFSNESTLRMRRPKYWSFSFSIIPSK